MLRRLTLLALVAAFALPAGAAAAPRPKLPPAERAAITKVLDAYVDGALLRHDIRRAYELSGPQVRGGMTLREWMHGGIPVYPFPARKETHDGWLVDWKQGNELGLSLLVQADPKTRRGAIAFNIQMIEVRGRWLVNAFLPQATFSDPREGAKVFSEQDLLPSGSHSALGGDSRLSAAWFAVPGGILLGGLILVPLGYLLHVRRRDRRAYREYLELNGET